MEFNQKNSNYLNQNNSIKQSLSLQQHLYFLELPIQELENFVIELFSNNPAIDDVKMAGGHLSSDLIFFKPEEPKEIFFEQIPTKLLSSPFKILAQEIFESLSEEGFLQKEEKKQLEERYPQFFNEILSQIQQSTALGFLDRIDYWIHLLLKKGNQSFVIDLLKRYKTSFLSADFKAIADQENLTLEVFKNQVLSVIKQCPWSPRPKKGLPENFTRIDAVIGIEENQIDLNVTDVTPSFTLTRHLDVRNVEVKEFYKPYLKEISVTIEGLKKRKETLEKVLKIICLHQIDYFCFLTDEPSHLDPQLIAEKLNLHPSTIARAIKDKVICTPRGVKSLKELATPQILNENKQSLLKKLLYLVRGENKKSPYSDLQLQKLLEKGGSKISRRTITKYRAQLKIPDARRRFFS